jgi:hypothetical protein
VKKIIFATQMTPDESYLFFINAIRGAWLPIPAGSEITCKQRWQQPALGDLR